MTTFSGKDLTIRWKEYVDAAGDVPQYEKQYRVEFTCATISVVKYVGANENYGTDTDGYRQYQCTLTYEENRQSGLTRSPTVKIYTQDAYGDWTAPALTVTANNPQSAFSTAPVLTSTVDGARLSLTKPADADVAGYLVYMDTTNPPAKTSAKLAYDGPNTSVGLYVSDYSTYYVQVAPYDQFGQDGLTYSTVQSFAKQPLNVQGILSNESVTLAADSSGTVASFATASGTFKVYDGLTDVTTGGAVTFSVASSNNCTVSIDSSGAYSATAMSADNASAVFQASYHGANIDRDFTLAKARAGGGGTPGTPGADAKLLSLISDKQTITYDAGGSANPSTQTTTFTTNKQNTTATVNWTITDGAGVSRTPVTTYLSAATGDSVTMTAAQFESARNGTQGVVVTASATDGVTLTDKISVVRVQQGAAGSTGPSGSAGTSAAIVHLYKRSASLPALPTTTSTYTFATGVLTGQDNGWTQTVPATNGNPLYITVATASSTGTTDTIANTEWATPTIMAQDGAAGSTGSAGTNNASVFLYQRSASVPSVPSVTTTYTFGSGGLSGINNGWSQTIPAANGNPLYVTLATASGTGATDTIANTEWATPAIMALDGSNGTSGANGLNNATVYLFQRAASAPAVPSVTTTYTFATSVLTGTNNGWSQSVPAPNGNPLYVTTATASSSASSDTIANTEWSSPSVLAQDGATGATGSTGAPGLNSASVFLYQRAASSPSAPSVTTTYTFATGALASINNGWSQTIPATNGLPCYVTTATASGTGATDTIANTEWASPTILVQDGATGTAGLHNAQVFIYQRAASAPALPNATTTYTFSTGVLTGLTNGWTQAVPAANGNPLYVTVATASSNTSTDTIAAAEWASAVVMAQDGATGATGSTGSTGAQGNPGLNSASVYLYQRAASAPSVPSVTTTYTFATGVLASINNGWSQSVPATNGLPLYVTIANALGSGTTDTIGNTEWSTPSVMAQDGATGPAGLHNAQVFLYQRAGSAPAVPSVTTTYTFSTGVLSSINNGWSQTVPATNGLPLYVTAATASASTTTDTIATGEWATPTVMAQDGATGATGSTGSTGATGPQGSAGLNTASVYLYQRAGSAPAVPSVTTTYTFSTGLLSGTNNGWTQTVPTTNGNPLYVIVATALSNTSTDTIANTEWSTPTVMAQDGATGPQGFNNSTVHLYQRANSAPSTPSATCTYTFTTGALTGQNNGWTQTVPAANGQPLYVTLATASAQGNTDTIATNEWATPVVMSQDGAAGSNGSNGNSQAGVYLYQRNAATPSVPSTTTTYTFSTGVLTGINNGWTQTIPAANGTPAWMITATALGPSGAATDTIANTEWSAPVQLADATTNPSTAPNRIRFSMFERNGIGWSQPENIGVSGTFNYGTSVGTPYIQNSGSFTATGQAISIGTDTGIASCLIPVNPGERIYFGAGLSINGTGATGSWGLYIGWLNASGAEVAPRWTVATGSGSMSYPTKQGGFFTVPSGIYNAFIRFDVNSGGAGTFNIAITQPMLCSAGVNQAVAPVFNPGPGNDSGATLGADLSSNVTNNTMDYLNDGGTYGRTLRTRLNGGRPVVDFSENIHSNTSYVYNSNISIASNGALTGAGGGQVTIGGLGGGPWATYSALSPQNMARANPNLFPYPSGVYDGRSPGQLGWGNTTGIGSGWQDVGNGHTTWIGGGYYQTWRTSGAATNLFPYYDFHWNDGGGFNVGASLYGYATNGTFSPYIEFWPQDYSSNLGSVTLTYNSASDRWEGFGATPTNTYWIRVVPRGIFAATSSYQDLTWNQIKIENAPNGYVTRYTEPVDVMSQPGALRQVGDQRNLPAINAMNLSYTWNGSISYVSNSTTQCTITAAAASVYIGNVTVSYNQMQAVVTSTAGSTITYYLYLDDPYYAGGTPTLQTTTNSNVVLQANGRVYVGQVTCAFPASSGTVGSGGGGYTGGGGGGGCVEENMWVITQDGYTLARDVEAGDWIYVLTPELDDTMWAQVTYNRPNPQPCFRITSESGIEVICSDSTPITLSDNSSIYPADIDGHKLPVWVDGNYSWERCTAEPVDTMTVQHISCGGHVYAAGVTPDAMIFTHNLIQQK